jgi:hypothetical protein
VNQVRVAEPAGSTEREARFDGTMTGVEFDACFRRRRVSLRWCRLNQINRPFGYTLLYPPSFEEPGIGRILLYIGCVALFSGIDVALLLGRVFSDVAIVTGSLMASIGGRHGWHFVMARHSCFLRSNYKGPVTSGPFQSHSARLHHSHFHGLIQMILASGHVFS